MIKLPHIETPGAKANRAIGKTVKNAYNLANKKLDEKFTKKQKHIIVGTGALALAGLGVAAMIGRDPARAAKTLNGSLARTKIYKQGEEMLAEMLKKKGAEYSVNLEDFNAFFKKSEKFDFEEAADILQKSLDKMPKDAADALNSLQGKIAGLIEQRKDGFITMDGISTDDAEKFILSTVEDMDVLRTFFEKNASNSSNKALLDSFNILESNFGLADGTFDASRLANFHRKINAFEMCPKNLLPENDIYYHGTGKAGSILRKGITPFRSNQINNSMMAAARECGAGIYLTPDVDVAQAFAGLGGPFGKVLPYKAENMTVGIASQEGILAFNKLVNSFMTERTDATVFDAIAEMDFEHINPIKLFKVSSRLVKLKNNNITVNEILTRKIILDNGFDAMYTTKGINSFKDVKISRHLADINSQLGRDERQFVVYSPEKIELQSRPIKTRVLDIKDRTFAAGKFMLNKLKGYGRMCKEIMADLDF